MAKKRNHKSPLIIIFIVIVIAVFFIFNSSKLTSTQIPQSKTISEAQPQNKFSHIVGFSFLYPEGWKISSGSTETSWYIEIDNPDSPPQGDKGYVPNIRIVITKNGFTSPVTNGVSTNIAGVEGKRYSFKGPKHLPFEQVRFEKNGYFYDIVLLYDTDDSYNKNNKNVIEQFDKMLSTFTFKD